MLQRMFPILLVVPCAPTLAAEPQCRVKLESYAIKPDRSRSKVGQPVTLQR